MNQSTLRAFDLAHLAHLELITPKPEDSLNFFVNVMTVDLGLGRPSGFGCTPTSTVTVSTLTAAPQITGTYAPGVYCVRIADTTGILPATATFSISIEHS